MSSYLKSSSRFISILLSFTLVFSLFAPQLTAAQAMNGNNSQKEKTGLQPDIGELPDKLPETKKELKSKRTKYSTRYLNPDGSFTEKVFLTPQFYKDQNNQWKEIDNNLITSKSNSKKVENKSNSFDAKFSKNLNEGSLVSLHKGNKSISMFPVNAKKVKGTVKGESILYDNVYPKTDLKYTVKGNGVKEDIVIEEYQGKNTFTFELKLKGLNVKQQDNGQIIFTNKKDTTKKFHFAEPYIIDASEDISKKVSMNLRKENGHTYIDVVAAKEYLESPDTEYPVTIDPTINTWNIMRDSFVSSNQSDQSYSSETFMHTGYTSYLGKTRGFMRFYLPTLPSDSKINDVSINAYQTKDLSQDVSVDLFRVTEDWGPSVTWTNQPTIGSTKESTVTSSSPQFILELGCYRVSNRLV